VSIYESLMDSDFPDDHSRVEDQRRSEIRACYNSLKTNIMITIITVLCLSILNFLPLILTSSLKAFSPVVTMFANFGKFQEFIKESNVFFRCLKLKKFPFFLKNHKS